MYRARFLPPPLESGDSITVIGFNIRPYKRNINQALRGVRSAAEALTVDEDESHVDGTDIVLITTPTVLSGDWGHVFFDEVETRLSYICGTVHKNQDITDAFITEGSVIPNVSPPV